MVPIGSKILENTMAIHRLEIQTIADNAKSGLALVRKNYSSTLNNEELTYLDKVIDFFKEDGYLGCDRVAIQQKINILPQLPVRTIFKDLKGLEVKSLTKHILEALNYEGLRKKFYPKFFRSLGISTCVYCNSQPALSVNRMSPKGRSTTVSSKFQLDHYVPKDRFPFLSICFYNLYPVCGTCNNAKKESDIDFDLYSDQPAKSYRFELSQATLARYLITGDSDQIKIIFIDPDTERFKDSKTKTFQDAFNIQGIYETQKDLAEELIIKSQVYTESYKAALKTSFGVFFSNENLSNRIMLGNYADIIDIHKRPMAKFMQDIARQLDLLK